MIRHQRDKHRGAHSELIACAWLLSCGYEVFRNISGVGHIDIVAIRGPVVLKIDVKTITAYGKRAQLKKHQDGVAALYVHPTGECELVLNPPRSATHTNRIVVPSERLNIPI